MAPHSTEMKCSALAAFTIEHGQEKYWQQKLLDYLHKDDGGCKVAAAARSWDETRMLVCLTTLISKD